jgi:hypothetical protein
MAEAALNRFNGKKYIKKESVCGPPFMPYAPTKLCARDLHHVQDNLGKGIYPTL